MAEISKCTCGTEPVWVRSNKRFIIACPNKQCDMNICNYPTQYEAVRRWNEEVERFGSTGKRD
mgnify:CR=1 FL=1